MKKFLLSIALAVALTSPALATTVTLNWTNPTTRTDGSAISGALAGQIWDLVTPPGAPPGGNPVQIGSGGPGFKTGQLAAGVHSFTVINCETGGACSAPSNVFTVTIVPVAPSAVTNLSGTQGP